MYLLQLILLQKAVGVFLAKSGLKDMLDKVPPLVILDYGNYP